MNFLEKIGDKIFDCALEAAVRQLNYLIHYKSNLDYLKTQVEELHKAKDRVKQDVEAAQRNVEEIHSDVQKWLNDSDGIIVEADEIIGDNGQAKLIMCCNGWCPNLKSRYRLSKRAVEMKSKVEESKKKSKFDIVGYRKPIQAVGIATLNRGYEAFESRMTALTGVLEALKDPNINTIGVYGTGGIGKTMLVKEVVAQAQRDKLFDEYPFVVVSQDPNFKKIQREIADQLNLIFDVKSEFVRADRLRERLQHKKVLIVIDDIWESSNLEALGIPFGNDKTGCKILLTSRFHNVLRSMEIQRKFLVGVLLENEARNLFQKIVVNLTKTLEIQDTMEEIIKECGGLPIAITTVATTLKNQENVNIWKDALTQLKMSSPTQIEGMHEKVYKSIKLSYKFLESNEAESLFLLCSLHGEDCNIDIDDLLRYGVGWGLFDNVYTIEDARCRVDTLVERLKDSSLLLDGDYNGTVKMHDVIRDVAINIAVEDKHMFTIRSAIDLKDLSKWNNSTAISLPDIDVRELPERLECSKLQLFLLFNQKDSFEIPDSFFGGLKELRVLKIPKISTAILPSSLSSLEKLQTLCLDGHVKDVTIIGELKNLKVLTLSLPNLEQLPKEIGQLSHLQLLDLKDCDKLKVIPSNVLSNLKRLEELYMPSSVEWETEVQSTNRSNTMVSELDHLSQLTTLHIRIQNPKILPKALIFKNLKRYRINIGGDDNLYFGLKNSRSLKLRISIQLDDGIKELLKTCEDLSIEDNDEIQDIIKSVGFPGIAFPNLESIDLSNLINLEWICNNQLPAESFRKLKVVNVDNCEKLEFVFSSSMVGSFSQLQEMKVSYCQVMSAIVSVLKEGKGEIEVNDDSTIVFAKLRSLTLSNLPQLMGFYYDSESDILFNEKVVFPNLEVLHIRRIPKMKIIWHNQRISDSFRKLERMTVENCDNLTNIVPPNMLRRLQNLQDLQITWCYSVEEVFEIQGTNVKEASDMAAIELRVLRLERLPKLKHVWSMDPQEIFSFEKLQVVHIICCRSLKSVFPTSVAKALVQLKYLHIQDCAVEEIVAKEEGIETVTLFLFPQLTSLTIGTLPELKSFYPGKHTSEWPSLKYLRIYNCDKLKVFGSNELSVQETSGLGHQIIPTQQPLFFIKKDKFPNLEIFHWEMDDAMNETYGGP